MAGMAWFRMYSEVLHDRKVQTLPPELFKAWVNLLCLANGGDVRGILPPPEDIAFALRLPDAEVVTVLAALEEHRLLDRLPCGRLTPHNWHVRQKPSDNPTPRVRKHRRKAAPDAIETLPKRFGNGLDTDIEGDTDSDTEAEQNQTQTPPIPPMRKTVAPVGADGVRVTDTEPDKDQTNPTSVSGGGKGADTWQRARWEEFLDAYGQSASWAKLRPLWEAACHGPQAFAAIMEGLAAWHQSERWQKDGGAFICSVKTFLEEERWKRPPRPAAARRRSGPLGGAALEEAVKRLRQERRRGTVDAAFTVQEVAPKVTLLPERREEG